MATPISFTNRERRESYGRKTGRTRARTPPVVTIKKKKQARNASSRGPVRVLQSRQRDRRSPISKTTDCQRYCGGAQERNRQISHHYGQMRRYGRINGEK